MLNRFAITAAIAVALAACGGGGSGSGPNTAMTGGGTTNPPMTGDGTTGNTPEPARPSPHEITTVGGNELKIDDTSTIWSVMDGRLVREPRTPGLSWVHNEDYRVFDWLPRSYNPSTPQIVQGEEWRNASWFYWGHWSDNDAISWFGGYQYEPGTTKRIARFGIAQENGEIDPYASGVKPLMDFVDSPRLSQGTAHYDGTLIGLTHDENRPIGGGVSIEFNLSKTDITGTFELDLVTFQRDGSLEPFLGGTLQQDIAVTGNTFTTTGGDPGTVTGIFAGEGHEAAAGTFQHSAFIGVFGAELVILERPGPAPAQ